MKLVLYTQSQSLKDHLRENLNWEFQHKSVLEKPDSAPGLINLLHIASYGEAGIEWLQRYQPGEHNRVIVFDDQPMIQTMLRYVELGIKGYCNSYMSPALFEQMLRLVDNNQSWFPPQLLEQTFELARLASTSVEENPHLQQLTPKEAEIATSVSNGNSNRLIAKEFAISEATVKTHLSNIFKKLGIKDRVALVLLIKNSNNL